MIVSLSRRQTMAALFIAMPIALGVNVAQATETIQANVIDGYPAKALWVKEFTNFFIPEVDKRLAKSGKYKMKWQES